ncbi:MAG: LysR family transcriptional regulator [Proteobacteria bacterium]|nr:LysR family transcriptional regulator [Pseudomonadota bacterium]
MRINELRAIATLAKSVELGSIRRAALAQGVSAQSASKLLAQFEKHLGARLLHRSTRSLALTDEGRRLLESTQPALATVERALAAAKQSRDDIAGPLRIVGPESAFIRVLAPLVDEYTRKYPLVEPDVQLDDHIGDWVQSRVDVGFRINTTPDPGLIARRLLPLQLVVCAAPAYLERHGRPNSLEDLAAHRCSVFRHPATGQMLPWCFDVSGSVVYRHLSPALSTNDAEFELQATLRGQVLGQLTNLTAAPYIRAGQLVPVLGKHVSSEYSVYLYYGNRNQPLRVKAFIDMAIERLTDSDTFVLSRKELGAGSVGRSTSSSSNASTQKKSP